MEVETDNAGKGTPPGIEIPGGASTSAASVPARTVAEMIELALHTCFERFGAVAALALPLFVLVFIPSALANWLSYREAAAFFSELAGSFSFQQFDPNALRFYLEGEMPTPETSGGALMNLLSVASWIGGVAFGPLVLGALVLLVLGQSLEIRLTAMQAWRGATRRAGSLIFTELVKAILLGLIALVSVLVGMVVLILGGSIIDLVVGSFDAGLAGALVVFILIFVGGMVMLGPVVYAYLLWIYTVPLVLLEGVSISRAFERSARLVKYRPAGQRVWDTHPMRLTGLLTLAGLILAVASLPASGPLLLWIGKTAGEISQNPAVIFSMPTSVFIFSVLLMILPQVVLAPVFHGSIALYYLDSRVRDEEQTRGGELVRDFLKELAEDGDPEPALPRVQPAPPAAPQQAPAYHPGRSLPSSWPDGM